jgi:serine/threonine protein kinase
MNGVCKLTDFGSSKSLSGFYDDQNLNTLTGTSYWMAPEMIKESGHGR